MKINTNVLYEEGTRVIFDDGPNQRTGEIVGFAGWRNGRWRIEGYVVEEDGPHGAKLVVVHPAAVRPEDDDAQPPVWERVDKFIQRYSENPDKQLLPAEFVPLIEAAGVSYDTASGLNMLARYQAQPAWLVLHKVASVLKCTFTNKPGVELHWEALVNAIDRKKKALKVAS